MIPEYKLIQKKRGTNTQSSPPTPRGSPIPATTGQGPRASRCASRRVQDQGSPVSHQMGTSPRNRAARLHHVLGQSREEHVNAHSAIREGGTVSESGDATLLRRVFTRPDTAYNSLRRSIEERISPSSGKYHRQNPPENEKYTRRCAGTSKEEQDLGGRPGTGGNG